MSDMVLDNFLCVYRRYVNNFHDKQRDTAEAFMWGAELTFGIYLHTQQPQY